MRNADINVASEFMALAAELLEIKSKMLLPRSVPEGGNGEIAEDPRTELMEKLLEYKRFKAISDMLERRCEEASEYLEKPQEDLAEYTGEPDEYLMLDIEQFKSAFEKFLNRRKRLEEIRRHHIRNEKQRVTTEIRIADIREFFAKAREREADFRELVKQRGDRYDTAVTFSSVLEMMRQQKLSARQKRIFGDITVRATDRLFAGG